MRYAYFLITLLWITSVFADEVFLLTKSLDFIPEGKKRQVTLRPKDQPTLIRKISEKNGITEVEIFQENGKSVSKRMSISTKWLAKGTQPDGTDASGLTSFNVDPNPIVASINPACEKEEQTQPALPVIPSAEACQVLTSGEDDVEKHLECFASIQQRLGFDQYPTNARATLSKLYTLSPDEQRFMAYVLTMYGEARSLTATGMASVAKVIDNRLKVARSMYPDANELDVVLQDSQFSMYNPWDSNWKSAITATPGEMREVVRVFATNAMKQCTAPDGVCHYATTSLCNSRRPPAWAKRSNRIEMDFSGLIEPPDNAHTFFKDIAWTFLPFNRYKGRI